MKGVTQLQGEGAGEQSSSDSVVVVGPHKTKSKAIVKAMGKAKGLRGIIEVVDVCCLQSNTGLRLISTHNYRCLYTIEIIANLTTVAMPSSNQT